MRKAALAILAVVSLQTAVASEELPFEEKATAKKTWTISGPVGQTELKVDNLDGSINVVGGSGPEVEIVANQTISAESSQKLQKAKQEVKLHLDQNDTEYVAYVDAPWRCRNGVSDRGWRYYGYKVSHDFQIKVPAQIRLYLRNVSGARLWCETWPASSISKTSTAG